MLSRPEEVAETSMSSEEIEYFLKNNPACKEVFSNSVWSVDATQILNFTDTPLGEAIGINRENVFRKVGEGRGKSSY